MNIFVLDADPVQAAKDQCDKHIVKMVTESAQILSTVLAKREVIVGPKATHHNHPCVIWAGETRLNYIWLALHFSGQLVEYTARYKRIHAYTHLVHAYDHFNALIPEGPLTPFAQAMPEQYRQEDAVEAYRAYYKGEKARFAEWRYSKRPDWWDLPQLR